MIESMNVTACFLLIVSLRWIFIMPCLSLTPLQVTYQRKTCWGISLVRFVLESSSQNESENDVEQGSCAKADVVPPSLRSR